MKQGFFVTGTDTGVGKTLIAAALMHRFAQRGVKVIGMKPVAAGASGRDGLLNEDVELLLEASNVEAPLRLINPYMFAAPIAPHIAAGLVAVQIAIAQVKLAFDALAGMADVVVVEGAGGLLVPLNDAEDMADLALMLAQPVILVIGMRLGCLNHALLTAAAIEAKGLSLAGWVANCMDPPMANLDANLATLKQRLAAPCLGVVPWSAGMHYRQAANYLELPH